MIKNKNQNSNHEKVKRQQSTVKESRIILLPVELQTKIIVYAQSPLIMYTCRYFWNLGQSPNLRANYLLYRYGGSHVLSERVLRQRGRIAIPQVVELLVRNPLCNPKGDGSYWVFKMACIKPDYQQLGRYIIESSLKYATNRNDLLRYLCIIAAREGSVEMIDILIDEYYADPNELQLAFTVACERNQVDMVIHLHRKYACDIHFASERYLRTACLKGHEQLAFYLLESGADVHAYRETALLNAISKNHIPIIRRLMMFGADPKADQGIYLRIVVRNGDISTFEFLIDEAGIDPRFNNDLPLKEACRYGHEALVKYLLDRIYQTTDTINMENGILLKIVSQYDRYSLLEILLTRHKAGLFSKETRRNIMKHISKIQNITTELLMRSLES